MFRGRFELPGLFKDLRECLLWPRGGYSIHTNFPVSSIADLKGKTIRASSKNESAALRAFGAVPIGMPVTEIPEAISRGTISGTT